jgi:hypothetical protein
MSTDLSTQVVPNLKDVVTDRVRAEFVRLIPDEAWKAMVEKELKFFTTATADQYNRGPVQSPVQVMIRDELRKLIADGIKKELETEAFRAAWDGQRHVVGPAIKEMLKELAPEMVGAMFAGVVQTATDQLRYQLTQLAGQT